MQLLYIEYIFLRKAFMKEIKSITYLLGLSAAAMMWSCSDPDALDRLYPKNRDIEVFDFNTSRAITLNVDYGGAGQWTNVRVLAEEPSIDSHNEYDLSNVQCLGTFFLDQDGCYTTTLNIPEGVKKVWIYANSIGVPGLQEVELTDSKVSVVLDTQDPGEAPSTRAMANENSEYQVWPIEDNYYSIVKWQPSTYEENPKYKFGGFDDPNHLVTYDTTKPYKKDTYKDMLNAIKMFLWEGRTSRPDTKLLTNGRHVVDNVNTIISTEVDGKQVTDAEISVMMIDECAATCNTFGYYYYPTGQVPDSPDEVEHFIIVPNSSMDGIQPMPYQKQAYGGSRYVSSEQAKAAFNYQREPHAPANKTVPVPTFTTVKLLYHDVENNCYTTKFPPGITVGYFVRCHAFDIGWKDPIAYYDATTCPEVWDRNKKSRIIPEGIDNSFYFKSGNVEEKQTQITYNLYSTAEWNRERGSKFVSMKYNDKYVYSVENSQYSDDGSYDDLIFMIEASPNTVIQETDAADVPEPKAIPEESGQVFRGYYCFEDQWPKPGDYDLNDVIISHSTEYYYNIYNVVTRVIEHFKPVQPAGSATFRNALVVGSMMGGYDGNNLSFSEPDGKRETIGDKHCLVLTDANAARGRDCTVTLKYTTTKYVKELLAITPASYNPYILPQYVEDATLRREVHLCDRQPSKVGDKEGASATALKYYYQQLNAKGTLTGKFPWGYAFTDSIAFVPAPEGTNISDFFPDFNPWAMSNGGKYKDWYKSHK